MNTLGTPDEHRAAPTTGELDLFAARLQRENQVAYKPVQVALEVPSGKLVISGTDFSNKYTNGWSNWPTHNSKCGYWADQKNKLEAYAERGLIYGYLANYAPTIFQNSNSIVLGSNPEEKLGGSIGDRIPGEAVGSLWSDSSCYCIADHDDYLSKGGETNQHWKHQRPEIVNVEPGRYVVTHHFGFGWSFFDPDSAGKIVCATLERSDAPISNPTYPEEVLESLVVELFPNSRYYAIEAVNPFEEFEIKISFDQGTDTTALIPVNRVKDRAFVKNAVDLAWQQRLEQREELKQIESTAMANLREMKDQEPEKFARLMEHIQGLSKS